MSHPPADGSRDRVAQSLFKELVGETAELVEFVREQIALSPEPGTLVPYLIRYAAKNGLPRDRQLLLGLVTVAGQSPFLADLLLQNPGHLSWAMGQLSRGEARTAEDLREDLARFRFTLSTLPDAAILRRFKHREYLRIALREFLGGLDLTDTLRDLSALADILLEESYCWVRQDLLNRYGAPQYTDDQGALCEATFAILSLGKLGGDELNYSSDIDLVYLFSREGQTSGVDARVDSILSNREFFTRLAEGVTALISGISAEGQVFRVDLGLRPGGKDGELVHSLRAALAYYRTWARNWERQAIIKARHSAGDPNLTRRFLTEVQSTVYPAESTPFLALEIKEMKDRIDEELSRTGTNEMDIKLGRGGLRELEFGIQALQLIHGGKEPWIREGNSLRALHRLADKGLVSFGEHSSLSRAYAFLRKVEHRLQLERNRQTNALPGTPESLRVLARRLGYREPAPEADSFLRDLEQHRATVRSFYDSVIVRVSQRSIDDVERDPFLDPLPEAELATILREAGIARTEEALRHLNRIRRLLAPERIRSTERKGMRKVSSPILQEAASGFEPGRAFANLERFLESLLLDADVTALFFRRSEWIPPLMRLFGKSQYLSQILTRRPEILLEMGDVAEYQREPDASRMASHLALRLREAGSLREAAALLRGFHQVQILRVGIRDVLRQDSVGRTLEQLSALAEACLVAGASAAENLTRDADSDVPMCVLGLGRLGYSELDYNSDLDLIFLAGPTENRTGSLEAARRRAEALVHLLTAATREGSLYNVDLRLRPGGREGDLVQTRQRLISYFRESADTWEKLAFLKARPVAGDRALGSEVIETIQAGIFEEDGGEGLAAEVREMKKRLEESREVDTDRPIHLKIGPGGILDVHFLIEFLQIRHHVGGPSGRNTLRMLSLLRDEGRIPEADYPHLYRGYVLLRGLDHSLRLLYDRSGDSLPRSPGLLARLAAEVGLPAAATEEAAAEALLQQLEEARLAIRGAFLHLVR